MGAHILDRDNTGAGREQLRITETDSSRKVIYSFVYSNTLGTYGAGIGTDTPKGRAPV